MDPGRSIQHEISSLKGTSWLFFRFCFLRFLSSTSYAFRAALFSHNASLTRTSSLYGCRMNKKFSLEGFGAIELNRGIIILRSLSLPLSVCFLWIKGMKSFCSPLCPGVTTGGGRQGLDHGSGVTIVLIWCVSWASVWDAVGGCCMRHIKCVCAGRCRAEGLLQSGNCCIAVTSVI